jgi:hypothetical protein
MFGLGSVVLAIMWLIFIIQVLADRSQSLVPAVCGGDRI